MHQVAEREKVSLTVRELSKSYDGRVVLDRLSFDVKPGELFVIMGPSGAGKSVLLRHIVGLEKPDAGIILINGLHVDDAKVRSRFRIAMVFQTGALLNSLTVFENVALYLREHRMCGEKEIERRVNEKLQLLGLEDAADKLPGQLSGGMRKRVAIARALIMDPHLVLFDEPTSELDPVNAALIGKEIYRLNREEGVTTIVVTHDRELGFSIADRVAIMINGKISVVGTPDEVSCATIPEVQLFINARIAKDNNQ